MKLSDEARDQVGESDQEIEDQIGAACRDAFARLPGVTYARVHPDELSRLWTVDAAAREYAEARAAWMDALTEDDPIAAGWADANARAEAARDALLALFAPSSPVVSSATTEAK